MSWIRDQLVPSPHLLDPKETVKASKTYFLRYGSSKVLQQEAADHLRAIEHEQAILMGLHEAIEETLRREEEYRNRRPSGGTTDGRKVEGASEGPPR